MKFILHYLVLTVVVLFVCSEISATDKIVLKNGVKTASITKLTKSAVMADGKSIPFNNIKEIIFSASELPAKNSGIILKNGTLISGVIRKLDKKEVSFRSTTFGLIQIPFNQVAAIFYVDTDSAINYLNKMKEFPAIMQSTGTQLTGKIMWCDMKSAGILTKSGLKKIPADKLGLVCYSKFNDKSQVVLRNGDKLPSPQQINGNLLKYSYGNVSLAAIKYFYPNNQINK